MLREDAPRVVPALIDALGDKDWALRMWAASSLGRFGPDARAAVVTLTELLKDPNESVRESAENALKRIKR
jgi:HEAT repeat protein